MTIKLHLFKGYPLPQRGITADTELGHLYSDTGDVKELYAAGGQLGLDRRWIQNSRTGVIHFDLWRRPLQRAKVMFPLASDEEFAADIENINRKGASND